MDFLTLNRGSDDHQDKPAKMKSLGGTGAQPLRHLDFLIYEPERSVLLYKGGIPVTIPRSERYAVHKLIVSAERKDQVKSAKDTLQAATLIEALASRRPMELANAWDVAWNTGPRWREKLEAGRARPAQQDSLAACRTKVCRQGMRSLMARKGDRRRAFMQPSARTSASSSRP